jgi:glycerol-3-phosphate dehydrogenase
VSPGADRPFSRDLETLVRSHFDVLVIGGGIAGACVAWDAALRGLSVALVDRGDFAAGTSSNSLKIIHGGLRYLQQLDFKRMRQSIQERSVWLRIAPHLVEPLPVLVPTYGHGLKSRAVLWSATRISDIVGWDRNRGLMPERVLPAARALSRGECLELVPELETRGLTGGVLFYDAQMYSSERLVLEIVQAAHAAGAVVANHVEIVEPLLDGSVLEGARARDALTTEALPIRARVVVNAAGPAAPHLNGLFVGAGGSAGRSGFCAAMNLVFPSTRHKVAFAFREREKGRYLFAVPWRERLMIGTAHYPYVGDPAAFQTGARDIRAFFEQIRSAWPGCPFAETDVQLVHGGLLPTVEGSPTHEARLLARHRVTDHRREGVPGLISVTSTKFTTGRLVAQEAVDGVVTKLGRRSLPCQTAVTPLPGASFSSLAGLMALARREYGPRVPPDVLQHLVRVYGSRFDRPLAYLNRHPKLSERVIPESPVIEAQLSYGAREEMALSAEDLLGRRTELGARGLRSEALTSRCHSALSGSVW